MAVAYRSHNTLALGSRTNSTLTAPSGIANGDLLLAIITGGDSGDRTGPTITPPAGWTAATGSPLNVDDNSDATYAFKINVFYKIAASEAGNYTFTHATADTNGIIYAFTGADPTTPLSPNMTTNRGGRVFGDTTASNGQTCTATGLTTAVNDSLLVYATASWDDAGPTTPPTGTTPTFTERFDPGTGGILYVADGVLATAGATGNKSNTNGNGFPTNVWGAVLICVRAAVAGGTTFAAAAGSYTLTGASAGLAGKAIADAGSYAITGFSATLAGKALAAAGSYALTGGTAAFVYGLPAGAGAYTLTGTAAAIVAGGNVTFAAAAYTLTGTAATFLVGGNYTLFCNPGAYTLTGTAATFPGNEPLPPVQPSTGGSGFPGAWSAPRRKKRKRDEIEELIDAVIQAPPIVRPTPLSKPQPSPPALIELMPKMRAVGLTPPQRKIVTRGIVSDDPDDDDEAIELLLNLLS